jgi:hypothetical protein
MKKFSLTAGLCGLFFYLPVYAEINFSGYIEGEARLYPSNGLLKDQKEALASIAIEPELSWKSASEDHSIRFKTFARYSDPDGHRDHADIRELYYNYAGTGWQAEVGINKVYWGVVESLHLVDIVNQTDFVESVNGEQKLGQPMVSFGLEQNWGNLDLYVLPYFRERKYPDGPERFRLNLNGQPINFDKNSPLYDSHKENEHIDYAIRWAKSFDTLDVGISYFSGTNREPIPILVDVIVIDPVPVPPIIDTSMSSYYEQMEQAGLELQYLYDDWAFKFEGVSKNLDTGDFNSTVIGFEYTLSDVGSSGGDLGLLVEYLWNDRQSVDIFPMSLEALPANDLALLSFLTPVQLAALQQSAIIPGDYLSPFENDIFLGTRFGLNDIGSTEFLAGIIVDADDQTTSGSFEGSTRIGDDVRISLNIYFFENVDEDSAFYPLRKDDQIEAKVAWYF